MPATGMVPDGYLAVQARMASIRSALARPTAAPAGRFGAALLAATADVAPASPLLAAAATGAVDGETTGAAAVSLAKEHLGTPYVWGGNQPGGFDCSGLVQHVYGKLGIDLPRVSRDQARAGEPVASLADARPGDLVFFDNSSDRAGIDHVGIYAGDGKMVVAPKRGDVVKIQEIRQSPTAIRRIAGAGAAPLRPASTPTAVRSGPATTATPYDELFASAGARHGVPPALLASVARAESGFNPRAVSHAGAQGLMQLMPATAAALGVDAFDPGSAVDGAARLLRSHLDAFGSPELALAAYNAGPGAVRKHGGIPPYQETQNYVRRVMAGLPGGTSWS